ncbi:MAG: hypothetical protein ACM3Q4_07700 [Acidobacteriota bacterium]
MKSLIMILLTMCLAASAYAGNIIRSGSLQATSDGNNITVKWGSTDETGIKEFGVERRALSGGDFMLIATVKPKGNSSSYEYVDQSAFKTTDTMYQYRIKVTAMDLSVSYSDPFQVRHSTSVGKRTWGSLKAMFR